MALAIKNRGFTIIKIILLDKKNLFNFSKNHRFVFRAYPKKFKILHFKILINQPGSN